MKRRVWVYGFALLFLCTCHRGLPGGTAQMKLALQFDDRAPSAASGFACYGVLVTGPGIPGESSDGNPENETSPRTNHCTYPGVGSSFVAASANTEIELKIPRGNDRLIQVVGLEDPNGRGCPSMTVAKFLSAARAKSSTATIYGGLYEIGRSVEDISASREITVQSNYDPGATANLRTCVGTTAYPDLVLSPSTLTIHPNGYYQFTTSGGVGSLTSAIYNSSGTAVTGFPTTGILTANPLAGTYRAKMKDSLDNIREAVVTVKSPGGTPSFWYRADDYWAAGTISGPWTNTAGSFGLTAAGGPTFTYTGGPNGHPAVNLGASTEFANNSVSTLNVGPTQAFVVAKTTGTSGVLFCIGNTSCTDPLGSFFVQLTAGNFYGNALNSSSDLTTPIPAPPGPFIAELVWDPGTLVKLSIDAAGTASDASANATVTASGFTITGGGTIQIGSAATGFQGQVSEVLVYNSALSASAAQSVRDYLKAKYDIN